MRRKLLLLGFMLTVFILLSLRVPRWISVGILNASLVRAMKSTACDPAWFVCKIDPDPYPLFGWDGNSGELLEIKNWLERGVSLDPDNTSIRIRLAETYFSLEDRDGSAEFIKQVNNPDPRRSVLLQDQSYQGQLVQAYKAYAEKNWERAIYHFRLGLSWGDERVLEADQADYLKALVEFMLGDAQINPGNREVNLAARYLLETGETDRAEKLMGVYAKNAEIQFTAYSQYLLGRIALDKGNTEAASKWFEQSIINSPDSRIPRILKILLDSNQDGRPEYTNRAKELEEMGPTYRLGVHGEGYSEDKPVVLSEDWTLIGYDLEEEMLEQAHFLDVWLWWQHPGVEPVGEDWIKVGKYWIQRQRVTNLFPNAGFEWGVDENGIPLGHDREFFNTPEGSLFITKTTEIETNHELVTNNSIEINHIALVGKRINIDSNSRYLISGSIFDQIGLATFGRICSIDDKNLDIPIFSLTYDPMRPINVWLNYSSLEFPYPGEIVDSCEFLLMNNANADLPALWDNILWIKIGDFKN